METNWEYTVTIIFAYLLSQAFKLNLYADIIIIIIVVILDFFVISIVSNKIVKEVLI